MFSVSADVVDHTTLPLERLQRRAKGLTGGVQVGVFTDKPHITDLKNGGKRSISMSKLAAIHEYGAPSRSIPARPFISQGVYINRNKYLRYIASKVAPALLGRTNVGEIMDDVGAMAVVDVQNFMETGRFVPLRPSTIKRKGHSQPLIDTRQLKRSIAANREGGRDDSLPWRGM